MFLCKDCIPEEYRSMFDVLPISHGVCERCRKIAACADFTARYEDASAAITAIGKFNERFKSHKRRGLVRGEDSGLDL
jgi:hypothetical protein